METLLIKAQRWNNSKLQLHSASQSVGAKMDDMSPSGVHKPRLLHVSREDIDQTKDYFCHLYVYVFMCLISLVFICCVVL